MEALLETNPVAVYRAMKDIVQVSSNKQSPFIPCKQKDTNDYSLEEGDDPSNFSKFIKRETINRKHHQDEDLSYVVSPYKNRVTIGESYKSSLGYKALN